VSSSRQPPGECTERFHSHHENGIRGLEGTKTWISNGGIADFYCVFARTSPAEIRGDGSTAARGISAFVIDSGQPGFSIESRIDVISPHPLATLRFEKCRIPASQRLGAEGEGFKLASRSFKPARLKRQSNFERIAADLAADDLADRSDGHQAAQRYRHQSDDGRSAEIPNPTASN
jgi:alkylation response protein AidB-like acyl-CoA dehydrogenase